LSKFLIHIWNDYYEHQVGEGFFNVQKNPRRSSFILETFVEIIFQSPFDIYDIKRMKITERSSNPKLTDEYFFQIPEKMTISDLTIDLIFRGKSSSLHHHAVVLGVLTLSKHTDWYPVRKFWIDLEENPNTRLKDRFLFEGNIYD
jgi:hypothetical protein